jgi:hypothetical protein
MSTHTSSLANWTATCVLTCLASATAGGCLPSDTRPPPGSIELSLASQHPDNRVLDTADGWRLELDRLLLSVGEAELDGDRCSTYAESDYLRVLDLQAPNPQKLATLYALGDCVLAFRMQGPDEDAVLGENVSRQDLVQLRAPGSDPFVPTRGTAFHIAGRATNGPVALSFDWSFRRDVQYRACGPVAVGEGQTRTLEVIFDLGRLFQPTLAEGDPSLSFGPFAMLDADGDGQLTLEELAATQSPGETSLGQGLYLTSVPGMLRVAGKNDCLVEALDE